MRYLHAHTDLICSLAKFEGGQNILKSYSSYYPKKPFNKYLVPPSIVKADMLSNHARDNLSVVSDQVSQDMVINPVKIIQEDSNIHEYREIYWWLLVNRMHPITREPVALEVGQDPDDILVLDEDKKQEIEDLLKTWLQENISEKLVDIIQAQEGIDFLLAFSDTVQT